MSQAFKNLVHATVDMKRSMVSLLPLYRSAISHDDFKVREYAVDSILLRAGIVDAREWAEFVGQLHAGERYIRSISWLGRVLGPMRRSAKPLGPAVQRKRQQTILWLIKYHPESRVHQRTEATLNGPGDEDAYDMAKSVWFKKILEYPANANILSNAAHFCAKRDPEVSRGLTSAFKKWQPRIVKWQQRLAKLKLPKAVGPAKGNSREKGGGNRAAGKRGAGKRGGPEKGPEKVAGTNRGGGRS